MTKKIYEKIKTGEIWWVNLSSNLDDPIGHETQKTRPCLVVANCKETKFLIIIPFQSNLNVSRLPHTLTIKKHQNNGLKNDSVATIFQMRSIDYKRIRSYSGTIRNNDLIKIKNIIKDLLSL